MSHPIGIAGRFASLFIRSKLTPLVIVSSILLGIYAVVALPREEEPQIIVPMIDVFVNLPGASPAEVEQRVTRPLEQRLWEVPGLEYLYSTSSPGRAMLIARFLVGEDEERALVRLNQKLAASAGLLPAESSAPLVQLRSIDDVPVMALTLWGAGYDAAQLRLLAAQLRDVLKEVPDTSEITILGGQPRQVTVELDPPALEARGLDPLRVQQALVQANVRLEGARVVGANSSTLVEAGRWPGRVAVPPDPVRRCAQRCARPAWRRGARHRCGRRTGSLRGVPCQRHRVTPGRDAFDRKAERHKRDRAHAAPEPESGNRPRATAAQ